MNEAIEALKNGLNFREAQRLFNVNKHDLEKFWNDYQKCYNIKSDFGVEQKETLQNDVNNCMFSPELSSSQEEVLVHYFHYAISHGFPFCKDVIKYYIKELGFWDELVSEKCLSVAWLNSFLSRYKLPIDICETLEDARKQMSSETALKQFFDLLRNNLEKNNLFYKQSQIWFSEENSFEDRVQDKFDFGVGFKHTYLKEVMSKEKIVINLCLNASGNMLPPMIVFGELKKDPNMFSGPKQSLYAFCNKGFDDIQLCHQWFRHFLHFAGDKRPLLLIQDQLNFHLAPSIIDFAEKNEIILLFLPLHCHPVLRPLDISLFIQTATVSSDSSFCSVLREAFSSITPEIIIHGFRKNGIFPFDPEQVNFQNIFKVSNQDSYDEHEIKKIKYYAKQLIPSSLQNGRDTSDSEIKSISSRKLEHKEIEHRSDFTSDDETKPRNQIRTRKRKNKIINDSPTYNEFEPKNKLENCDSSPDLLQKQQSFKEMLKQYPCHKLSTDKTTYEDVLLYTYNRVCTLKWLLDMKLIADNRKCEVCKSEMDLQAVEQDSTWQDGFVWACRKNGDKSHFICDIREGSWLRNKSVNLEKSIRLTYMWCSGYPQDLIRHELQLPASICVQWARMCREYSADICTKCEEMLGGDDAIVEVDLLQVTMRTSEHGPDQYIIGGSDTKSQIVFLTPLIHDNSKVISDILKSWIKKGTAIFPVGWDPSEKLDEEAMYMLNNQYNFQFLTQNDYVQLFGSVSNWLQTKAALQAKGSVKDEYYWAYFGEFLWRRQSQQHDKFQQFIQYISDTYQSELTEQFLGKHKTI